MRSSKLASVIIALSILKIDGSKKYIVLWAVQFLKGQQRLGMLTPLK